MNNAKQTVLWHLTPKKLAKPHSAVFNGEQLFGKKCRKLTTYLGIKMVCSIFLILLRNCWKIWKVGSVELREEYLIWVWIFTEKTCELGSNCTELETKWPGNSSKKAPKSCLKTLFCSVSLSCSAPSPSWIISNSQ